MLMVRSYRNHIKKGMASPAALREAQLWLRKATRKEIDGYYASFIQTSQQKPFEVSIGIKADERPYESPYYWGGFTYNGASIDGRCIDFEAAKP